MDQIGPCLPTAPAIHALNAILNTVQVVLVAWLAQRALSRDRKEKRENGDSKL